jgi:hypothetical protein
MLREYMLSHPKYLLSSVITIHSQDYGFLRGLNLFELTHVVFSWIH